MRIQECGYIVYMYKSLPVSLIHVCFKVSIAQLIPKCICGRRNRDKFEKEIEELERSERITREKYNATKV